MGASPAGPTPRFRPLSSSAAVAAAAAAQSSVARQRFTVVHTAASDENASRSVAVRRTRAHSREEVRRKRKNPRRHIAHRDRKTRRDDGRRRIAEFHRRPVRRDRRGRPRRTDAGPFPVALRGRGVGEISPASGLAVFRLRRRRSAASSRRRRSCRPDGRLREGHGSVQERPEADDRHVLRGIVGHGDRRHHAGWQAQETVHMHVLRPGIQQVVQPADTREDAHGRAAVSLRRVRQGVPQTGPSQGSQVRAHEGQAVFLRILRQRILPDAHADQSPEERAVPVVSVPEAPGDNGHANRRRFGRDDILRRRRHRRRCRRPGHGPERESHRFQHQNAVGNRRRPIDPKKKNKYRFTVVVAPIMCCT